MKFKVETVRGTQAQGAYLRLGLVKITRRSAEALYDLGIPLVVIGNKVNSFHFFGGWHLAFDVDSSSYLSEDVSFASMVNNWSRYNENPETGTIAFFVEKKRLHLTSDYDRAMRRGD